MPAADKAAVISMLESRSKLLEEKLKVLTARRRRTAKPKGQVLFELNSEAGERIRGKLRELQSADRREAFYGDLFKKAGVSRDDFDATRGDVNSWTGGYRLSSTQRRLYGAFASMLGNASEHPVDQATAERLRRVGPTRARRWELFLESVGEKPVAPTHIRAYRGVNGLEWVRDVAKAWSDAATPSVMARSHELASWSMDKKCGKAFADGDTASVVYRWEVPLGESTHDQVTDDASFIHTWFSEHEIIAGPGHERGITLPKEHAVVTFEGKRYTYDERAALISKLRTRGHL